VKCPLIGDSDLAVAKLYNMLPADEPGSAEGRTAATSTRSCAGWSAPRPNLRFVKQPG